MSLGGKRVRIGSFCYTPAWIVSVTSVRISQAWKRDDCLSAILCPRVYTFVGTGTLSLMINPSVGTGTGRFETRLHTGQNPQHFRYLCAAKQADVLSVFVFVLSVFETKLRSQSATFHYISEANQANVLSLFVFVLSIFETKVHVSHNPQLQHFHYFCEQADVLSGRQKKVVWLPLQTFTPFIFLSLWRLMMGNRVLLELDSKYMRLNEWWPSHFEKSQCKENYAILPCEIYNWFIWSRINTYILFVC